MKRSISLVLLCSLSSLLFAQLPGPQNSSRSALNPALYPFFHGISSGDPLSDRVIIWTRITLDPALDPVSVSWEMATDTSFSNLVNSGTAATDSSIDYTVKVDVTGLTQNTWYYYRFRFDTLRSVTGRTRTLPTGAVNNIRFAVASCQDYQDGYYNAHRHIAQRNDIDAVLFLGDYTYESGVNATAVGGRFHEPTSKTIQLVDYRIRQSLYHLDPDLQAAHQQYPWICVWDDHETANNSFKDGAKNHGVSDGPWYDRKENAVKAYHEWMPVRFPDASDTFKIFRKFTWGDLADLDMLDTRLYDRDKQVTTSTFVSVTDTMLLDSTRNMLGPAQFDWLKQSLDSSHARWQIIGQQVMMTPLVVPAGFLGPTPVIINSDQWDGYPFDRQKFYDHILNNNIQNVVVLTGDIHTSWASDLPLSNYDAQNRQNSVGVEYVCSSITSGNELNAAVSVPLIQSLAPHVRYVDLAKHGYYILDITQARTQGDFVYMSNVTTKSFTTLNGPFWFVNDGETFLREGVSFTTAQNSYPPLAEFPALPSAVINILNNITTVSIHPNPFYDEVIVQFNVQVSDALSLEIINAEGKLMMKKNIGRINAGLNFLAFDGSNFPSGMYTVHLQGSNGVSGKTIIKVN